MKLEDIKKIMPNISYKQMEYGTELKTEILMEGKYKNYQFYILNLGTHPTAYVEIPRHNKMFREDYTNLVGIMHIGTIIMDLTKDGLVIIINMIRSGLQKKYLMM